MGYKNFFKIKKIKRTFLFKPEYIILFITTFVSLLYFAWGINSWRFSFVGDEWAYYTFAKEIAEKNFLVNPFDYRGVYLQNSVLVSLHQALFLKILGASNFSWRISNTILIIPVTIFFFLWIKRSFNIHIAFFSTLILQSSFYLANYSKIGYSYPLCFTLFIICLYVAKSCSDNPIVKNFVLLGLILGVSFYTYIGPLFPLLIWPYLLPLLTKKHFKKKLVLKIFSLGLSYAIMLSPILIDITQLEGPAGKTVFFKEYSNNFQIIINIFHNFLLFYKNYDIGYNHFVSGPYLDIASRILAFIGIFILIFNVRKKERKGLPLLLAYISTCVVIGVTSSYSYAPTTRGLFFLPFGFAFAGLAIYELTKNFSSKKFIAAPIILVIFLLNVYQSQIGVFKETGYTGTALIIKSLQEAKESNSEGKIILLLSNSSGYNYQNIYTMQQAYGLQNIKFEVLRISQIKCNALKKADILLFDNDIEAKNAISYLVCPLNYNLSIKTLNPSIYL